jgi:hypothetical protein
MKADTARKIYRFADTSVFLAQCISNVVALLKPAVLAPVTHLEKLALETAVKNLEMALENQKTAKIQLEAALNLEDLTP